MRNRRFGKNTQLLEETFTFRGFDELFGKKCQKVAHFVKKAEKSSIWRKYSTFRGNYHVLRFWVTFWKKVGKKGSFHEKA